MKSRKKGTISNRKRLAEIGKAFYGFKEREELDSIIHKRFHQQIVFDKEVVEEIFDPCYEWSLFRSGHGKETKKQAKST